MHPSTSAPIKANGRVTLTSVESAKSSKTAKYQATIARLLADRPMAYHPDMAKALGGVKAAVFLLQLLYWNHNPTAEERRGWFWKTSHDLYDEIGMSDDEQTSTRGYLAGAGLIEVKLDYPVFHIREGGTRTMWHRVHWYRVNLKKLTALMDLYYQTGVPLIPRKSGNPRHQSQPRDHGRFAKATKVGLHRQNRPSAPTNTVGHTE